MKNDFYNEENPTWVTNTQALKYLNDVCTNSYRRRKISSIIDRSYNVMKELKKMDNVDLRTYLWKLYWNERSNVIEETLPLLEFELLSNFIDTLKKIVLLRGTTLP